jgi:hypothetical protein
MRNLIVVAIVSALAGAGVGHLATARTSGGVQQSAASAEISPFEIMKSSGQLAVETFKDPM